MKRSLREFFWIPLPAIPPHLASRVRIEQIDALATLGGALGGIGSLAAGVVTSIFWHSASHTYLLGFLLTFLFLYAAAFRRSLIWRRRKADHVVSVKAYWSRSLHVGVIGLLWSSMPLYLARDADNNQMLMIVYVSSGLIASSVVIAPTLLAALFISLPVALGTLLSMIMYRGTAGPMLAVLILLYTTLVVVSTIHAHRSFIHRTINKMELEEQGEVVGLLLHEFEEESHDWLWRTNAEDKLQRVPERMIDAFSDENLPLLGEYFLEVLKKIIATDKNNIAAFNELKQSFERARPFRGVLVGVRIDDGVRWWSISGRPISRLDGSFNGYCGVVSDVTSAEESRLRIAHMASHDGLTGLPNRSKITDLLDLKFSELHGDFALLWADLDQFSQVNDTYGHAAGDALLLAVAKRLCLCVGPDETVARWGGDEFVILQTRSSLKDAEVLAKLIIEKVRAPYEIFDTRMEIGVSVGIAMAPKDSNSAEGLLKYADLALYRAKAEERGTFKFFEAEMALQSQLARQLQNDLQHAAERGELSLVFQPIIHLASSRPSIVEVLLRWDHPTKGKIPPAHFIALAEQAGTILGIGEWVLLRACEEAATWPNHVRLAVNISPAQLQQPNLANMVMQTLRQSEIDPTRLELEVTESLFLNADSIVKNNMQQLRNHGITFALDDFGTGYSSLSYLRSFPFEKVKIDKSFIRDILSDNGSLTIVRAIVSMAVSLGLEVTAEGVESAEELRVVESVGCALVQGFFYSRPVVAEVIKQFLWSEAL